MSKRKETGNPKKKLSAKESPAADTKGKKGKIPTLSTSKKGAPAAMDVGGAMGEPQDPELLEAMEEQEEMAVLAKASGGGGDAAANAAKAAAGPETSASFKNFRHHPDMENFYRFIYENDLRYEALAIVDEILVDKQNRKKMKAAGASTQKAKAH